MPYIDRDTGEGSSSGQAACWLDIKRTYLELRPRLRWVYTCCCDAQLYRCSFEQLGFLLADEGRPLLDRVVQHTFCLDMGVDSVDGWLGNLLLRKSAQQRAGNGAGSWLPLSANNLICAPRSKLKCFRGEPQESG